MSGAQPNQQTEPARPAGADRSSPGLTGPVLTLALLVVALAVAGTVFDGTLRTVAGGVIGVAIVVCAGFTGAAVKRSRSKP
ncbi:MULTISPECIES: hypothetical protein [Streptomyces]|uniref:Uncharacterized protein n=1 Tax=Streptomyces cremeus TaxID=66881 RepID=A0ABV5P8X3_STRCM